MIGRFIFQYQFERWMPSGNQTWLAGKSTITSCFSYENLHVVGDFPRSHVWWPEGGGKTMVPWQPSSCTLPSTRGQWSTALVLWRSPMPERCGASFFGDGRDGHCGWCKWSLSSMISLAKCEMTGPLLPGLTIIGTSALLLPWSLQFLWSGWSEQLQGNAGAAMRYLQRIRDVGGTPEAGTPPTGTKQRQREISRKRGG